MSQKATETDKKQVVKESETQAFHTIAVDLGKCSFPNLDDVWEVLDEAERNG